MSPDSRAPAPTQIGTGQVLKAASTPSVPRAYLSGVEAGRFQGHEDGRRAGYRDGYEVGYLDGAVAGWRAAGHDERRRFALDPVRDIGPSFTERRRRQRERERSLGKPLRSVAECLATWGLA